MMQFAQRLVTQFPLLNVTGCSDPFSSWNVLFDSHHMPGGGGTFRSQLGVAELIENAKLTEL
jgi:hypothetical protein